MRPEFSVVVESYTHGEGSGLSRFRQSLGAAVAMVESAGDGEVLVADSSGDEELLELLARDFLTVRRIDALALGYDEAKAKAAREAQGRVVLYLDGDCLPADGWLEAHLRAFRAGAPATGGVTRYDGGFGGAVATLLDFGFLYPATDRPLGCYASNNCGFLRELLADAPMPDGPMRCRCFAHAQLLERRGTPVRLLPEARVRHERQPLLRERFRQGYDLVAACWTDPSLPDARLLRLGLGAAPVFYFRTVRLDLVRLRRNWRDFGLARWQAPVAAAVVPVLRLVDLAGIVRALAPGGRESRVGLTPLAR